MICFIGRWKDRIAVWTPWARLQLLLAVSGAWGVLKNFNDACAALVRNGHPLNGAGKNLSGLKPEELDGPR